MSHTRDGADEALDRLLLPSSNDASESPSVPAAEPMTFSLMSQERASGQRAAHPPLAHSLTPPPPPSYPPPIYQPNAQSGLGTPTRSSGSKQLRTSRPGSRSSSRPGSRQSSRAPSPTASESSDELPNNVCREEQLKLLPSECLSGDPERPLRHVEESGSVTLYALQPMRYSVVFILLVELLERFSFYGLNYTQTSYLTGVYDPKWNAGMAAVTASSYVSISVAVAYTTPFLGALLADSLLGDYWSILVGALVFYIPGLFLIAFTTIPGLLGKEFNTAALGVGLLFLWPTGTGVVKSIVNIFGAKQHHPLLQTSLIESYYVSFYMCINIGALVGGILVPVWAQHNVTQAYFIPVIVLTLGVLLFLLGGPRYVRSEPKNNVCDWLGSKPKKSPIYTATPSSDSIPLSTIFRISLLVVPFNIAYSQMATTFIVQGTVMRKAFGWIDAASMNNADAVAVLLFGYAVGTHLYPALADRGIKIPTTYKFAFGSALGALAIGWALIVEAMIHAKYEATGHRVGILWQSWSYILIGAGEIFAVSAAYEVAFTASPPEKKVLASALNLFCIGGLPNIISIVLYQACSPWFHNSLGTNSISHVDEYATAHIGRYFWLLFVICIFGVWLNLLPQVREFVESIEDKATDLIKSPKTPKVPPRALRDEEQSPLIRIKRHDAYLKYGSGPVLHKQGSMRAGPSLANKRAKTERHLKRSMIPKLYQDKSKSEPAIGVGTLMSADGKPIRAGDLLMMRHRTDDDFSPLKRTTSD